MPKLPLLWGTEPRLVLKNGPHLKDVGSQVVRWVADDVDALLERLAHLELVHTMKC